MAEKSSQKTQPKTSATQKTIASTPKPVAVSPRTTKIAASRNPITSTPKPVIAKSSKKPNPTKEEEHKTANNSKPLFSSTEHAQKKVASYEKRKHKEEKHEQKLKQKPKINVKVSKQASTNKKNATKSATLSSKLIICAVSLALSGIFFLFSFLFLLKRENAYFVAKSDYTSSQSEQEFVFPNYDNSEILSPNINADGQKVTPPVQTFGEHEKEYYPSYFNPLTLSNEKKQALFDENKQIIDDTPAAVAEGRLKKHISADGQFYGMVPDDAPRIVKKVNINHIVPRRHSLGVFAPAGEILTVTIDESMVGKNLLVMIGYPRVENNVSGPEKFGRMAGNRMPCLNVSFRLTSTETKIGSPFGGMVILEDVNGASEDFSITISGGVDSPDYLLGVSTKEDWQKIMKSPSPYVWLISPYVYHIAPKAYLQNVNDPYDAMMLWHKAASLSLYTIGRENFTTPIMQIYDDYVPTGAAVAFQWGFFSILPASWCSGALSYEGTIKSGGWGNFHEFNHHNQCLQYSANPWGIGDNTEVTNNALNAMTYIAYTDIAASRTDTIGPANGSHWEVISDPYYNYRKLTSEAQKVTNFESLGTNKVFAYADLMHNFGVEKFAEFVRAMYGLVEGFEENSLISNSFYKTEDGFALVACKFFEKDFVDYFTKVWKLNLSEQTISEIKSLGYEEFFSLSNVYSAGIKGLETGRSYKVNVGVENVFDFVGKTYCSAENATLKKIGTPQNGKLTRNEDGTYSYVMNKNAKEDEFDLVYEVSLNGKNFERTLKVKLVASINFVEKTTYSAENGKNILDVIQTANEETKTSTTITNNFTTGVENGINLTRFRAKVVFPETKKLTFLVYGDDKTYANIDGNEIYTNTYMMLGDALKQTTNKVKLTVQKDVPILIDAFCYNTGGAGGMYLKISEDDTTFADIPNEYLYYYDILPSEIEFYSKQTPTNHPTLFNLNTNYFNQFHSNKIDVSRSIKSIKVQTPDGKSVLVNNESSVPENMFDGDTSTQFHTAWQGKVTPMPHEYYIEFENETNISQATFRFWNNGVEGYYAFGDFELYSSDDGQTFTKFFEGHNTKTTCVLDFEKDVTARFIKLVVKSNAIGKNFTCISEIEFAQTYKGATKNVVSSNGSKLVYNGTWKEEAGMFLNNTSAKSTNGTLKFAVKGTAFAVYSTNDASKILIDGKEYDMGANTVRTSPSFVINDLSDTTHLVEIQGQNIRICAIKTDGQILSINDLETGYLPLAVIIILTICVFAICTATPLLIQKLCCKKKKK